MEFVLEPVSLLLSACGTIIILLLSLIGYIGKKASDKMINKVEELIKVTQQVSINQEVDKVRHNIIEKTLEQHGGEIGQLKDRVTILEAE